MPDLLSGTLPGSFPGVDGFALVLSELVSLKDIRMARLFKNLELALDVIKLTFDYRFFLKSGLNFTRLGANREVFRNQFIPLKYPISMIDRSGNHRQPVIALGDASPARKFASGCKS
jgi:hypothetical protein